jgi:hypothetical protein
VSAKFVPRILTPEQRSSFCRFRWNCVTVWLQIRISSKTW